MKPVMFMGRVESKQIKRLSLQNCPESSRMSLEGSWRAGIAPGFRGKGSGVSEMTRGFRRKPTGFHRKGPGFPELIRGFRGRPPRFRAQGRGVPGSPRGVIENQSGEPRKPSANRNRQFASRNGSPASIIGRLCSLECLRTRFTWLWAGGVSARRPIPRAV